MIEERTVAAVVPAYNEAAQIRQTLDRLPPLIDRVILVDDGSRDDTVAQARRSKRSFDLLRHSSNRGVGAAISSGCLRAHACGDDVVVVVGGDGQMAPEDLPALLAPLLADEADFVKGNRLAWPDARERMPLLRWVGNHLLSALTRFALDVTWSDSQCGYAAMNRHALSRVQWSELWRGYGYPNDLLCQIRLQDIRLREVPVRPVYADERSGIRLRHALVTIPLVIGNAWLRFRRAGAIDRPWPTSTSSTATPMESARSRSCATPIRDKALSSRG